MMASDPKTQRQRIDRSQTHYPNKGPNARRRCKNCIDKKKGCYTRIGNDKCDWCIQRKQACITTHAEEGAKGTVLMPARPLLDTLRVPSQSYFHAPNSVDSSTVNSFVDEESSRFEVNPFRNLGFETPEIHTHWPKIKEMAAGRIDASEKHYHHNRLERDTIKVHPSQQMSDPSHFELSEHEEREGMGAITDLPLAHPDHFTNPYIDLDDDQAAFGNRHTHHYQESDLRGSADGTGAQIDRGVEQGFGLDDSGHVAFGQSGDFSDFEDAGAFPDMLFGQNCDPAKLHKSAEPVGYNAAGIPMMDAQHGSNWGWDLVQGFENEHAPPVRSSKGKARADGIFVDNSASPIRNPKGKERAIDVTRLEDSEKTRSSGEQAGAFLGENNDMTCSTIPGTKVFNASEVMAIAAKFTPLMVYQEHGTTLSSESESATIPVEPKFSNGPLQPILCCDQVKMQVYSQTYNKTEGEHNAIGAFMKKLIGKAPISVAHGPLFAGNNVWEDYEYLFATVCTNNNKTSTFRLFGTNDEIDGPDASADINYTELFVYDRPMMICSSENNGVDELLIRSFGVDFNCKIHINFSPCHAYLVRYQRKRTPLKHAQLPRQGDEQNGSTNTRSGRNRHRRRR